MCIFTLSNKHTMTNIQILNEKVKMILGNRYEAVNAKGLVINFSGYKISNTLLLSEIERKAGTEMKKEIAKLCLLIQFGRL